MKKKKIFIYMHQCILKGGVEKVFYNFLNNLPQDKYDITVLSVMGYLTNDLHAGLYPDNVRRRWLYYDEFYPKGIRRFAQRVHNYLMPKLYPALLKLRRYDTAIAAQEGEYARFIIDHVSANKKLLWIHNDMEQCHWTERYFGSIEKEREYYLKFDNVVCVSHTVSESMESVFGEMDNLVVCYNPIDTNEIDRKLSEFSISRDAQVPLFVAVGRLAEQKGFDRLLRICRLLNNDGFKYAVWIVGDGEKREELESEIKIGGLYNVKLCGYQENPYPYMEEADWLICTSRHEGFNMVLQEAAWCGTPSITTDNAGTKEFLGDSEYGLVVDNDEEAVYQAMKAVLVDSKILERYNEAIQTRKLTINLDNRVSQILNIM